MEDIEQEESNKKGQRSRKCMVPSCQENGRVLANLGGVLISYCPRHRKKYGERVINALINSAFNYKLTKFLLSVKADIYMKEDFFCESCGSKMKEYIIEKTEELNGLIQYAEDNEIEKITEELD